MTNKEALIATMQAPGYSDAAVEKALLDAEIDVGEDYAIASKATIDLIAIDVLKGMLAVASISEGGYSIGYSIEGIKLRISALETVNGISVQPKVRALDY